MGYYTEKAKEVKAKQDAELEQLKAALQTLGVDTLGIASRASFIRCAIKIYR